VSARDLTENGRFEDLDRTALHNALLALHTCPNCRADLLPVAFCEDVWGCRPCRETWNIRAEA
jgi:ribosomal protein L37AE/L43A